jgi:hypothetical protein
MPDRWHSHRAIVDFSRAPPRTFTHRLRLFAMELCISWRNRWYFHFTLHDAWRRTNHVQRNPTRLACAAVVFAFGTVALA